MTLSPKAKILLTCSTYLILLHLLVYYLALVEDVKFYSISFLVLPYGYKFTGLLSASLLVLYSLLAVVVLPDVRKFKSIDEQISSFFRDVTVYLKSGTTLYEAISLAKRNLRGYFKAMIERLDTLISLGVSFDDAVDMVLKDVGVKYGYVMRTFSVAMRSGGRSVDVMERASNILSYLHTYRDYRRRTFRQYLVLLLMIVIVYDFTVAFVVLILNSLTSAGALFIVKPDVELIYTLMYYISVVVSLVSGVSCGKSIEGSIIMAFPYVLLALIINFVLIHTLPTLVLVSFRS